MVNGTTKNILTETWQGGRKAALNGLSDVLVNPKLQQRICDAFGSERCRLMVLLPRHYDDAK